MPVKIKAWGAPKEQMAKLGLHSWSVCRLFELAKNLPVMEIPLEHLALDYYYEKMSLREMLTHLKAANEADLSYPVILDEDGVIMDGRHRLMKAILLGLSTIKAVRFEENPPPCREADK